LFSLPTSQTLHYLDNIILTWKTVFYNLFLMAGGIIVFVMGIEQHP